MFCPGLMLTLIHLFSVQARFCIVPCFPGLKCVLFSFDDNFESDKAGQCTWYVKVLSGAATVK